MLFNAFCLSRLSTWSSFLKLDNVKSKGFLRVHYSSQSELWSEWVLKIHSVNKNWKPPINSHFYSESSPTTRNLCHFPLVTNLCAAGRQSHTRYIPFFDTFQFVLLWHYAWPRQYIRTTLNTQPILHLYWTPFLIYRHPSVSLGLGS